MTSRILSRGSGHSRKWGIIILLAWRSLNSYPVRIVKVKVKLLSRVWLFATPWTEAYQAPPPMGFSRQEYFRSTSKDITWHMISIFIVFYTMGHHPAFASGFKGYCTNLGKELVRSVWILMDSVLKVQSILVNFWTVKKLVLHRDLQVISAYIYAFW